MKIGFLINDLQSGGAERATVSLASSFAEKGNDVEIITFKGGDCFYSVSDKVTLKSVKFDEIEHGASLKRLFGAVGRMFRLRKFIKEENLDVLIGMSFSMTYYTVFTTAFTKTKSVGTERNNPYKYKADKLNTFLRKFFFHLADGYIFQTLKSAEFFGKKALKKGVVIPNAIFNTNIYNVAPPKSRDKVICAVGRLAEQKRFDLLIDAFAKIAKDIPDYNLVIFGEGELRNELQSKVDGYGLNDRIMLPGADPQAYKSVCNASVFVLSSDYEGMPNALMETIAMGVPSISTDCDMGPGEIINNGENGILVRTGSIKEIAEAILKILNDDELAKKLSDNGRKLLETNSIENISNRWLEYMKSI
ncbi:MAG: glycosyltransferase family 4 protein [Clostridia bacterium]|nr:glycosyltransferase family 4 protein [Clostridia bacterium]